MKTPVFKKLVWAFDALEDLESHHNVLFLLGAIARATSAEVAPVFILSPPFADTVPGAPSDLEKAYVALAEKLLNTVMSTSDIATMTSARVLIDRETSLRKHVSYLIAYAKEQNVDAIVVATHARKEVSRFFLGSFAESLALHSDIPIFTVNPATKIRESIANILLPTSFAPRWRPVFERTVAFAKLIEANLTLFFREPVIPMLEMSTDLDRYFERERMDRLAAARQWQAWALNCGVKTEINIDNKPGFLAEAIEEAAASGNFDLIAMGTQSDATSAVLMGSATRQVIRQAPCPVWIMRIAE